VPQILLNNPVQSIKRPSQPPQHQLPTSTRMPHLSLNSSSPPRRYSADDVDYLRRAMFILETEQHVDVSMSVVSDASGTTDFSTPTTTALQDNETRQVGAHDVRPRRVEKTSSPTSSPSPKFFHSDSVDTCTSTSTDSSTRRDRAQESLLASDDPFMFQFEM
jgi:hypothetical protein